MAAKSRALAEKIESLVDHADRARRARDAENALRHRDEPYGKEVGDAYDAIKRALAELHEAGDDPVKVMAATKKAIAAAHKLMDGLDALAAATADPQRKQELANARNAVGDAADGLQVCAHSDCMALCGGAAKQSTIRASPSTAATLALCSPKKSQSLSCSLFLSPPPFFCA